MRTHSCIACYFGAAVLGRLSGVLLLAAVPFCHANLAWDSAWSVKLNGQLLSVETFTSRLTPDAAAQALARLNGAYERYVVADGRILLSGLADGRHWLAEIHGRSDGAQGYVSALYFDPARLPGMPVALDAPGAGAGAGGRSSGAFAFPLSATVSQTFEFGREAVVRLLAVPAYPSAQALASLLRRQGWRAEDPVPEWAQASRDGEHLSVLLASGAHPPTVVAVSTRGH
ncbi:hypothetical protein H0A73_08445 [Alcaligenaceae bacterium]|nr:hypothetical protein [Alcaligenaceae bacterium]